MKLEKEEYLQILYALDRREQMLETNIKRLENTNKTLNKRENVILKINQKYLESLLKARDKIVKEYKKWI